MMRATVERTDILKVASFTEIVLYELHVSCVIELVPDCYRLVRETTIRK